MNKINDLIKNSKSVPASVYFCEIVAIEEKLKSTSSVKLVISPSYFTYLKYIKTLGKPISRLI